MKVLVFGLPGSGKTYACERIAKAFGDRAVHINGDQMREEADDWDFSEAGRWRQFRRMLNKANAVDDAGKVALIDFICPFKSAREQMEADLVIFMNHITTSEYEDTNKMFEWPKYAEYDYDVGWDRDQFDWIDMAWTIGHRLFDPEKPTVQMLGRFQPWHDGHLALFKRALEKTGQVSLQIRNVPFDAGDNPYTSFEVQQHIRHELVSYAGLVDISIVPNITNITYGREVGYKIEQEHFDKEIEEISATKIREYTKKSTSH
tara:strand:- start:476 stop:1258 length:783 start_codon:yes stop_codon:yes gene_type:complete